MDSDDAAPEKASEKTTGKETGKPRLSAGWKIFWANIIPALITAIVGGAVVGLLAPQIQYNYSIRQTINSKKLELLLSTAEVYTGWMNQWRKTNRIQEEIKKFGEELKGLKDAGPEKRESLEKQVKEQKALRQKELELRGEFFRKLQSHLVLVEHIFEGQEAKAAVNDFRTWYDTAVKTNEEIEVEPGKPIVEKRIALLNAMGRELGQSLK